MLRRGERGGGGNRLTALLKWRLWLGLGASVVDCCLDFGGQEDAYVISFSERVTV